jgi:Domain of unknown function (DUF4122)
MEDIVYLSIRIACASYLLYKVWGQKKKVREICDLLYTKEPSAGEKKKEPEAPPSKQADEPNVMGSTRFVYLDENVGQAVAPYMTEPLEMNTGYTEDNEDVPEEEVECKLPLEEMKMLKEEQVELDETSPEVDTITQAVTPTDLDNAGDVLFQLNDADKDEDKSRRAALTLHAIRETDLFEIFSSQVENKNIIANLMDKFLDENGEPITAKREKKVLQLDCNWRNLI